MEFMIFFALISIIFSVWLVIYLELNEEVLLKRDRSSIEDVGKSIQTQLFAATEARPGFYSRNLIIPERSRTRSYSMNNTPYILQLITEREDAVFNIPFTNGTLKKGQNTLWNICGVVFVGDYPPVYDLNCTSIKVANCSDGKDNDGDSLTDIQDGGCWFGYNNPSYNYRDLNETAVDPSILGTAGQMDEVYNFYVLCLNANNSLPSMCPTLPFMTSYLSTIGLSPITPCDCCENTNENFCSDYCATC